VLGFVEGVDVAVPMVKGRYEWGYEREKVVKLLEGDSTLGLVRC
jgi:hypothetical protein